MKWSHPVASSVNLNINFRSVGSGSRKWPIRFHWLQRRIFQCGWIDLFPRLIANFDLFRTTIASCLWWHAGVVMISTGNPTPGAAPFHFFRCKINDSIFFVCLVILELEFCVCVCVCVCVCWVIIETKCLLKQRRRMWAIHQWLLELLVRMAGVECVTKRLHLSEFSYSPRPQWKRIASNSSHPAQFCPHFSNLFAGDFVLNLLAS